MNGLLDKVEALALEHGRLDKSVISEKNIKVALRNSDGSGVVVGITSKGQVKGYERKYKGSSKKGEQLLNDIHLPEVRGANEDGHVTPALAMFYMIHGYVPDSDVLSHFEKKVLDTRVSKTDPVAGKLSYCGYNVADIVRSLKKERRFGFDEVAYLLLTGELPSRRDLSELSASLAEKRVLPKRERAHIIQESDNYDQMGALHTAVSNLRKFDIDLDDTGIRHATEQCIDIIAKMSTIVAYNYNAMLFQQGKRNAGFVQPDPSLSTAQNFLYMLNGEVPDIQIANMFDLAMILHAEHGGGNNSTFTVRTVTSTDPNTYMALTAGIGSLSGKLHGGANLQVINMIERMKRPACDGGIAQKDWGDEDVVTDYLREVLADKKGPGGGKIYGIGHAVYTISDPRAIEFRRMAKSLALKLGRMEEFKLYDTVAKAGIKLLEAKARQAGNPKKYCINVDFYSGFVYSMMGIPKEVYTPIFAASRVTGWAAHSIEQRIQGGGVMRPAYVSSIPEPLIFLPMACRVRSKAA